MKAKPYIYYYKTIYLAFLISLLIFPNKPKLLEKFDNYQKYGMIEKNLSLSKVAKGINFGWGMTFIDDHSLLITEKSGGILKVNTITNITDSYFRLKKGNESISINDFIYSEVNCEEIDQIRKINGGRVRKQPAGSAGHCCFATNKWLLRPRAARALLRPTPHLCID